MKNEHYYLYMIQFSDGRFYIGSRKSECEPEKDTGYMGSPVTFKHLWEDPNLIKTKHILKEVNSYSELRRLEPIFIQKAWEKFGSDKCVNRNASPAFHPESSKKGGLECYKLKKGIHGMTREERIRCGSLGGKKSAEIIREKYARECTLLSPEGKLVQFKNIREFSQIHNLDQSNLTKVINRKRVSHKGYRLP